MKLELRSMPEVSLDQVAGALNRGFADYLWPVHFTPAVLLAMVRRDGIHADRSQVVLGDGEAVGAGLVAVRGWTCRLAGMAIAPEARRQGVGRWLLDQLVAGARACAEHAMVLEVIEQNTPALCLYQSAGFRVVRRLLGYAAATSRAGQPDQALEEVDLREVARMVTLQGVPDLPWQLSGESLASLGAPARGYRLGTAYAVLSAPDGPAVSLQALVAPPEARGREEAARLLGALLARYADRQWTVPPLFPEEMRGLFVGLGFEPLSLSQLQMELPLA